MTRAVAPDPLPLTPAQIRALVCAVARELSWGLRKAAKESYGWRRRAQQIPDSSIRADALHALEYKRGHADGAALFSVLPDTRNRELLRLLVAYETILDFLDNVSERHTSEENGRELHRALIDALEPGRPLADYYRYHSSSDDGGYLESLVESCRRWCEALPSYKAVQPWVIQEAHRAQALALNHLSDPLNRDAALRAWADREFPTERDLSWFELSGAASSSLVVLALMTLAAGDRVDDAEIADTYSVYWPWVSLAAVMLDSYVDQAEDQLNGNHSYVAHYSSSEVAVRRLRRSIRRSAQGALKLRKGARHAVIVSSMVAMYLSKDSARAPDMSLNTRRLIRSGGSLTQLLLPVLRVWRTVYSQRSA